MQYVIWIYLLFWHVHWVHSFLFDSFILCLFILRCSSKGERDPVVARERPVVARERERPVVARERVIPVEAKEREREMQ
jgi:hypothetical protein